MIWLLAGLLLLLAGLSQRYRSQRDDLAAWIVYTHPEDFDDEATNESAGSGNSGSE